jgi:hypothetical protein
MSSALFVALCRLGQNPGILHTLKGRGRLYRMRARVSRKLHDRNEELAATIRDIAWKAQLRLCARYRRLVAAGKQRVVVTTAIAREMVGFIWAIARVAQPALAG